MKQLRFNLTILSLYFAIHILPVHSQQTNCDSTVKQILFVFDVSGSMSGNRIIQAKQFGVKIARQYEGKNVRIAVLSFGGGCYNDATVLEQTFTTNIDYVVKAINNLELRGGTPLAPAIEAAYNEILKSPDPDQTRVILLNDGANGCGDVNEVLSRRRNDLPCVQFTSIGIELQMDETGRPEKAMQDLQQVAVTTGGKYIPLDNVQNLQGVTVPQNKPVEYKPPQIIAPAEALRCITWKGFLYQPKDGMREQYRLSFDVQQLGNNISGISRIEYLDKPLTNYGIMQMQGTMKGSFLEIEETQIKEEVLENGYWFLKKGSLTLRRATNNTEADSLFGILVGNRPDKNDYRNAELEIRLGSTCFVPPPKPKPLPPPIVQEAPPVVQEPPPRPAPAVPALPRSTTLRVQVQDDLFDPLNAFVVFRDADTGEQLDERFSHDGVCIINVPVGKRISVTAEKPGYEADRLGGLPASETVIIQPDSNRASLFLRRLGRWTNEVAKQGVALSFPPLLFYVDTDILLPESQAVIQRLARQLRETLQQTPTTKFAIEGHTSDEGSAEHNLRLSVNRALAIVRILESTGIPSSQLRWEGFGRVFPITDNGSEEGRQRNRRVEIRMKQ
jgi:outer membrane protein OmpA-like peptidoglycan-associated protein/Mg-chelatase subunit ChlD